MKAVTTVIFLLMVNILLCQSLSNSFLYPYNYNSGVDHSHTFSDSTKFAVYLPSFQFGLEQEGPTFSSYFRTDDSGKVVIDPLQAIEFASDENSFRSGGELTGIGFGIKLNERMSVVGRYSANYIGDVEYPLDALQLLTRGNSILLGTDVDLSFTSQSQAYHQYQLSYNYKAKTFTVGIGLAYLSGILDASVERSQLLLEVSSFFYSIRSNTDFRLNATNTIVYNGLDNVFLSYNGSFSDSFFSSNSGLGIELFGDFKISEQTNMKAKVSGLGFINWKSDPVNYSSNGQESFSGFNILDIITENQSIDYIDSLENLFNIIETTQSYRTTLPINIDIGIFHQFNSQMMFSLAANYVDFSSGSAYQIGGAINYHALNNLVIAASLNNHSRQGLTFGAGLTLKFPYFSIWAYTGNIAVIQNQLDAVVTSASIGAKINFGKLEQQMPSKL
jgi:hypothetical protein